jgi:hypothetical protein
MKYKEIAEEKRLLTIKENKYVAKEKEKAKTDKLF